jgi:hypothetical protein
MGDLIPDPGHTRTHPRRQIEKLRASIETFGFTNSIVADLDRPTYRRPRSGRSGDDEIALNAGFDPPIRPLSRAILRVALLNAGKRPLFFFRRLVLLEEDRKVALSLML